MKKPTKLNEAERTIQELRDNLGRERQQNERLQKEKEVLQTEIHRLEGEVRGMERTFKIILANTSK